MSLFLPLDVIKVADWLIDLGPEGGDGGGKLLAEGTPEDVARREDSHTGQFLKPVLVHRAPQIMDRASRAG